MMVLRNGVAAFLRNGNNYLLMKRTDDRKIAPGVWSGIGGHMAPLEINTPNSACYREIKEESGIDKSKIYSLDLMYIIIRRNEDEIWQNYIFFGETSQTDFTQTDEGELFWIPKEELLNREYTKTFTAMLEHYTSRSLQNRAVYVGVAENNGGTLKMSWTRCEDFEK
jgi:8-oxo-dGTP diphosphatase